MSNLKKIETVNHLINSPSKVTEMKPNLSLTQLKKMVKNEDILKAGILIIAQKYLSLVDKGKMINKESALEILVDDILENSSNLELQDIDFIFKNGIKGKFGVIYNDIGLDTILGKDGWIETYYKEYRILRPEGNEKIIEVEIPKNAISEDEYFKKYPDAEKRVKINRLFVKAKSNQLQLSDILEFYILKGYTENECTEDLEIIKKEYQENEYNSVTESIYILNWGKNFILSNYKKTK